MTRCRPTTNDDEDNHLLYYTVQTLMILCLKRTLKSPVTPETVLSHFEPMATTKVNLRRHLYLVMIIIRISIDTIF